MPGDFGPSLDRAQRSLGSGVDVCFITPIKNLPLRWEADAECLKEGAMGSGRGTRSRREGEKQFHRQHTQMNS